MYVESFCGTIPCSSCFSSVFREFSDKDGKGATTGNRNCKKLREGIIIQIRPKICSSEVDHWEIKRHDCKCSNVDEDPPTGCSQHAWKQREFCRVVQLTWQNNRVGSLSQYLSQLKGVVCTGDTVGNFLKYLHSQ